MTINLGPELENKAKSFVAAGRFSSIEEVIDAGLEALEQNETWRNYVNDRIDRGIADMDAGRTVPGEHVLERLRTAGLQHA